MRIAIVDDHPVFIEGLAGLLAHVPQVTTLDRGTSRADMERVLCQRPEILFLDILLPEHSAPQPKRYLDPSEIHTFAGLSPTTRFVLVTSQWRQSLIEMLGDSLQGYILKDDWAIFRDMGALIEMIMADRVIVSPMVREHIAQQGQNLSRYRRSPLLTSELLDTLVAIYRNEDAQNSELTKELALSVGGYNKRIKALKDCFGCRTVRGVISAAIREGVLEPIPELHWPRGLA